MLTKKSVDLTLPTVRVADYWTKLSDRRIKCLLCQRACTLRLGQQGMCRSRIYMNDELHVITYGNLSTMEIKPIENTPFYHFHPGALTLAVGSWFCNLACIWCQNFEITRTNPPRTRDDIFYVGPKALIRLAKAKNVKGILFSYNEPSVSLFEYSKDVIPLAKKEGFFTAYVTNGYFSLDALEELVSIGLDAIHVDVKGCAPQINPFIGGKMDYIWTFLKHAWELGLHVEISTLVIPEITDEPTCMESIAKRLSQELSPFVPLHVLKYYPFFRAELFGVTKVPPDEIVLRQARIAQQYLHHVYVGNLTRITSFDHTWCPKCKTLLIERNKTTVTKSFVTSDMKCPRCDFSVTIKGEILTNDTSSELLSGNEIGSERDDYWMMKTRSPKHQHESAK